MTEEMSSYQYYITERFWPGQRVIVTEGAGLNTHRKGTVVDHRNYSQKQIKDEDPGRYYRFDPDREVLIIDENGRIFAMFPQYLRHLNPVQKWISYD